MTGMQTSILSSLEARRRALGMTVDALARRSKVSRATVQRILSGDNASASFQNVIAVAGALGLNANFDPVADDREFLEQQAQKKAKYLVGIVQGTMALEAQGVGPSEVNRMVRETTLKLLSGSKRKLWR
jgi:transcriptional regulator with XRE-family HTH domain